MTARHHVCFVTRAPFVSGAETSLLQLLLGLKRAGHRVHVICGQDGAVRELYASHEVATTVVPLVNTDLWHPLRFRRCVKKIGGILRQCGATVLHANDLPSYQAASLAARKLGVPRVCHARWLVEEASACWFAKYGVERVVAVSAFLRDHLLEKCPRVFEGKTTAILDGLATAAAFTQADRVTAREKLGLPVDRPVCLYAGQFTPVKGIADLLDAARLYLAGGHPAMTFCLVGDDLSGGGAYRREMMARAQGALPDADVRFVGFQKDVKPWAAAADCVVVPSLVDPLGMTVMESMVAGRVVIGTRVGGIPEMIIDGKTGWLVNPACPDELASALAKVVEDAPRRDAMEREAASRAGRLFDLDEYVRRVVAVYDDLQERKTQ